MVPFIISGKKLSEKQLIDLITKNKTGKIKNVLVPGSSEAKDVIFVLDDQFNVGIE